MIRFLLDVESKHCDVDFGIVLVLLWIKYNEDKSSLDEIFKCSTEMCPSHALIPLTAILLLVCKRVEHADGYDWVIRLDTSSQTVSRKHAVREG